ncbi:MAG TPA: nuclease-related domain-containing protein, partial [Chloroflexota bacterium]|nr:nuclease-related domain-containing protein [Chloroflexota bacterium]
MYPQQMPEDVASSAERLLYQEFQRQLPDTFIVMYSVKWLMRDRTHHDRDGEIDFLIVHRALGLLVLEVKGGRIRIDSRTRQWYTMDRDNHETLLKKSPFDQARDNLYALKSKLEEVPKTRPYIYRLQRGVAFPNVVVDQSDIGLYGDREIVIDSTDLGRLEATVKRIMGSPEHGPALSEAAERALVDTLEPSLEIR